MLSPPPPTTICTLSYPTPQILLVTLNRPKELNTIPSAGHWELQRIWQWMDGNPALLVGIFTGSGRAFCTGADLREWIAQPEEEQGILPQDGFCGISTRRGAKPVLCAVNGLAIGGGCEVLINADMVFCSPTAVLALPDVKVGLTLLGGTLPLLVHKIGRGNATDMVLTGRNVSPEEALRWGLVDRVVDDPVAEAVKTAKLMVMGSPDAVWASREGIFMGLGGGDVYAKGKEFQEMFWAPFLREGRNSKEGVSAFVERRKPRWDYGWKKMGESKL